MEFISCFIPTLLLRDFAIILSLSHFTLTLFYGYRTRLLIQPDYAVILTLYRRY